MGNNPDQDEKSGATDWKQRCSIFFASVLIFSAIQACAITATRPVQEMSDTSASIRAAREVQADTLAPELFRQSNEWFLRARNEYKIKNFDLAKQYADKSRRFAEQAEFESLRNGGNRKEVQVTDPMNKAQPIPTPKAEEEDEPMPEPVGISVDAYEEQQKRAAADKKRAEEEAKKQVPAAPNFLNPKTAPLGPIPPRQ